MIGNESGLIFWITLELTFQGIMNKVFQLYVFAIPQNISEFINQQKLASMNPTY